MRSDVRRRCCRREGERPAENRQRLTIDQTSRGDGECRQRRVQYDRFIVCFDRESCLVHGEAEGGIIIADRIVAQSHAHRRARRNHIGRSHDVCRRSRACAG